MIEVLRKLKYKVQAQPVTVQYLQDLGLPDSCTKFIQKVYLLIKIKKEQHEFECFLFELNTSISNAHKWMRDVNIGLHRKRRDIYYLFFCTNNYKQLLIGSTKPNSDPTDVSLCQVVIDCINPTTHDWNFLNKLSIGNFQSLYEALANISKFKKAERVSSEDSLGIYLREIGRIPRLKASEEIKLAYKVADLNELERVRKQLRNQLDRAPQDSEWAEAVPLSLPALRDRLHIGRKAKDKMIQSNLRLVVHIAKRYQGRGMELQDLIQEGNLGLIKAAQKFHSRGGAKFSTYAVYWIRSYITSSIDNQSRVIRLGADLCKDIWRIKKTIELLTQEIGRKPTEEEIAIRMEIMIEKVRFVVKSAKTTLSLDAPLDRGEGAEGSCISDIIESSSPTPEEWVNKNFLREDLMEVLGTLSVRERDVIRLRYGLDDGRMRSLEEIGQIFNVNRERIRQIQEKSFRKLRHPNRNSIIKLYIC